MEFIIHKFLFIIYKFVRYKTLLQNLKFFLTVLILLTLLILPIKDRQHQLRKRYYKLTKLTQKYFIRKSRKFSNF